MVTIIEYFKQLIIDTRDSLWQTAAEYIGKKYPGRLLAIINDVCFYVAQNHTGISTKFAHVNSITKTVQVHIDDLADYSPFQKVNSEISLIIKNTSRYLISFITGGVRIQPHQTNTVAFLVSFLLYPEMG